MKFFLLFCTLFASLAELAGEVFAIVTVEFTELSSDPFRQFVIGLDPGHAPRSVSAFMLMGEPREDFFRNRLATLSLNPSGDYVPATEGGTLLFPSSNVYTITANDSSNAPSSAVVRGPGGSILANLTRDGAVWDSDNPAITLRYNDNPNVLRYMLDVRAEFTYFDSSDNFYASSNDSVTDPTGDYQTSQADGSAPQGEAVYRVAATLTDSEITGATLTRIANPILAATFTRMGSDWTSDNPGFELSVATGEGFVLRENVAIVPTLTQEPFYDDEELILNGGAFPHLSLGRTKALANQRNGLVFQNEVVDVNAANFTSLSLWGNRFANTSGFVGPGQRYAVAFANSELEAPNTAGGEILITGFGGNPLFEGPHTHIGDVVSSTYSRLGGGTVPASRFIVDQIVSGAPAVVRRIEFENRSNSFDPLEFSNPMRPETRLPRPILLAERSTPFVTTNNSEIEIFAGGLPGQLRSLERSSDLSSWSSFTLAGNPVNAQARYGLNVGRPSQLDTSTGTRRSIQEVFPRSFFRTTPLAIDHPQWPAARFEDVLPGASFRFRGRRVAGGNPEDLNFFNLFLDTTGQVAILEGVGGDLRGNHFVSSVRYQQTGPLTGELELEGETLPELVRMRLAFDSHKQGELTGGREPIERFYRLRIQDIGSDEGAVFREVVSEFGVWSAIN